MIIRNASVYTEDGIFVEKDIYIANGRFVNGEDKVTDTQVISAVGCYAIPGLTDIHFHGCMGFDFCDGTREAVDEIAAYELSGYRIRLLDVAPETEGAMEMIEKCHDHVVVSLAHTCADYDTAMEAFDAGASHMTHLYNAMPPYTHRAPGPIGAAADRQKVEVELITDGVHIHPASVRTTFKMFGDDRIILISDSMRATGLEDGDYTLGGQDVKVTGNKAVLADGTIAGSVTNLFECMRTAVLHMGIPLEAAVKCAAVNPAKSVGIYDEYGSISPGKKADVVLIRKEDFTIKHVILEGGLV